MFESLITIAKGFLISKGMMADTYVPPKTFPKTIAKPGVTIPLPPVKNSLPWEGVVIHHSASADTPFKDTDGIIKYHTSYRIDFNIVSEEEFNRRQAIGDGKKFEKPWIAVGYHYLIEVIGKDIQLVPGRSLLLPGAHAGFNNDSYFNKKYLGLCCIGSFDKVAPSAALWNFTLGTVRDMMSKYMFTQEKVLGHRETFARWNVPPEKTCPGTMWDMEKFRKAL